MNRREFLAGASAAIVSNSAMMALGSSAPSVKHPRAITMWEFSWIERRWPGAGYEDWDEALDELVERGYDAVRIDAFPHLVSADPAKLWTIRSDGQDGDWGAPADVDIHVTDTLIEFIGK